MTVEISGITIVLPLESTVLPVIIPPNFTADFHWYTTGNTTGIPLVISENFFYGDARATSSKIGNPDRDGRIRLVPHRGLDRDNSVQTYVIVSERETRTG